MAELNVSSIIQKIEEIAPKDLAMNYDNVGLLVGSMNSKVSRVLVGLELTDDLLEEAIGKKCELIIVHHPLIFSPLKKVVDSDPISARVIELIKHDISLYAAHTNLDTAVGGLNDFVMELLGMETIHSSEEIKNYRVGQMKAIKLIDFVHRVKQLLGLEVIHYCGDDDRMISRIGLCTGSGFSFYKEAILDGIDVYVTGDIKYHDATMALDMDVPLIDATHFASEVLVKNLFSNTLEKGFGDDLTIYKSTQEKNPIKTV